MANVLQPDINAIPVVVINGVSGLPTSTGDTAGQFISGSVNFNETTANQAANATFTGSVRNSISPAKYCFFIGDVFSDAAGTLFVERSVDGNTWRPANGSAGQAIAAGSSVQVKLPITTSNYRVRYTNGATATTSFLLTSAFTLN